MIESNPQLHSIKFPKLKYIGGNSIRRRTAFAVSFWSDKGRIVGIDSDRQRKRSTERLNMDRKCRRFRIYRLLTTFYTGQF